MDTPDLQPAVSIVDRSSEIGQLASALATAQGQIAGASKDSENPHFRSKYADLASIWDACRGALSTNGLAIIQPVSATGACVTVTTLLAHKSGEWISSTLTLTAAQNTPQGVGSAITYGRRYALASMVGVAPEDDDGEAAAGRVPESRPTERRRAPQPAAKPDSPKPASQSAPTEEKPWKTFKEMLACFATAKAKVGDTSYYATLEKFGVTHANEFRAGDPVLDCYRALAALMEVK